MGSNGESWVVVGTSGCLYVSDWTEGGMEGHNLTQSAGAFQVSEWVGEWWGNRKFYEWDFKDTFTLQRNQQESMN